MMYGNSKGVIAALFMVLLALSGTGAKASDMFGIESLNGDFVVAADGGFVAQTPFATDPLRLNVAMVGRISFDGNGLANGNWTISFHNAAVPIGVRSQFRTMGTYQVEADGHLFMEFEEFKIDPVNGDDGVADAIVGFECYIVRRQQEARCVLNSLVSLIQGPEPVAEPVTLSGTLLRQR